jgi:hypothetical protein
LNDLQLSTAGFYTVVVSNAIGTVSYTTEVGIETAILQTELSANNEILRLWLPSGTNVQSVLEASTDLHNWTPLFPYSPPASIRYFEVPVINTSTQQFFRTRQLQ